MTRKAYGSPSTEMVYSEQTVLAGFTNANVTCKSPTNGNASSMPVYCPGRVVCDQVETDAKAGNPWSNPWSVWEDDEEE